MTKDLPIHIHHDIWVGKQGVAPSVNGFWVLRWEPIPYFLLPDPDFPSSIFLGVPDDKNAENGKCTCRLSDTFKLEFGLTRMVTTVGLGNETVRRISIRMTALSSHGMVR